MAVRLKLDRGYLYRRLAVACKPADRLTVSAWADRHRVLSSKQSGERGKWKTARNPILREIMDCLSVTSPVSEVVVMKSSQVGVTEATVNWLGYIMEHAPAPTMVLMPTLESRDSWKVQKLNPLLTETECVRDILGGLRSRDAANSKDLIDFPGGILFLAGGNSPNSYAQKSVRNLVMDDLDRFPSEIGEEGDPVGLARGRLKAFSRSKLVLISTPTVKDASLIEREYLASDQRRFYVPCPACGEAQSLKWSNLKWNLAAGQVWYECEHCGTCLEEHHKPAMLATGVWKPENPDHRRRGYHLSALYAPIGLGPSWLDLAQQFTLARQDTATLKTFINTDLGETWEDQASSLKSNDLLRRVDDVPLRTIPPSILALTAGIDTQDSWLAITVLGWSASGHRIIDWHEIQGDTTRLEVWDELEVYLNTPLLNAFGKAMRYRGALIDSRGHRGEQVRNFVQRPGLRIPVFAGQGSTTRMGKAIASSPSYPDKTRKGKVLRGSFGLWNVGTEYCKAFLYGALASDADRAPEDRAFQFGQGLEVEYFDGLLSEVYDPEARRYVQKKGARFKRNEPLDTLVYAWAVGAHREVMIGRSRNGKPDPYYWERLEAMLEQRDSMAENTVSVAGPDETKDSGISSIPAPRRPDSKQAASSRGRISLSGMRRWV